MIDCNSNELRADENIVDEPQEQFYDLAKISADLKNYEEWPSDPKKRVVGKKYIKKGKIVECGSGGKGATLAKGTIEQTVIDSNIKHKGKYKFPIQEYSNNKTKIRIHCSECNKPFQQTPHNHLRHTQGCPDCGRERRADARKSNTEEFIEKAREAQGDDFDNYDYSKVEYKGRRIPVNIFCRNCDKPFQQTPDSHLKGHGCPGCVNRTQCKVSKFLIRTCGEHNVEDEKKYDWCRNPETGYHYRFDFEHEDIIIEVDGDQHIDKQISNWTSPEKQQERDMYKMTQAINNGKHVIRILQRDVWNDTYDWEKKLLQTIIELKDIADTTIRCIGDCDVYKEYTVVIDEV